MTDMLLSPTPSEAEEFAGTHMHGAGARDNVLIVVGCCSVEYSGRARSTLGWGERIVVVKPDGSVLVHQMVGREPVNWQPPDTRVRYQIETDNNIHLFVIYSYRFNISAHRLRDDQVLQITGVESDIADRIMSDPGMIEEGLRITDREKQTRSRAIDLYGIDRDHTPVIIEIKRSQPTPSAVFQLKAHVLDHEHKHTETVRVRGILCAPNIPVMIRTLLTENRLKWREFDYEFEQVDDAQSNIFDYV
jgi:RecB family endonuclease NucS